MRTWSQDLRETEGLGIGRICGHLSQSPPSAQGYPLCRWPLLAERSSVNLQSIPASIGFLSWLTCYLARVRPWQHSCFSPGILPSGILYQHGEALWLQIELFNVDTNTQVSQTTAETVLLPFPTCWFGLLLLFWPSESLLTDKSLVLRF